jgi:hypothetical protein
VKGASRNLARKNTEGNARTHTHTHTHIYIYIYIYISPQQERAVRGKRRGPVEAEESFWLLKMRTTGGREGTITTPFG